ncbi:hypothetical protein RUM44_003370 [Polyplax serrata]|uniref:Uncharacterized protein n=1 Tax=Polyplax serrata TaxID=468196 RepID=A0ABR1AGA2_POLSC
MELKLESIRYAHKSGHTDVCYGYNYSDKQIFSCGSDGYVRIWHEQQDDDLGSDFVAEQALSVACNETHYFVATNDNYVQGYTLADRKRDKIVFKFSAPVTHVFASESGKLVAACSCDMEIQLLQTVTNKIETFTGHTAPVLSVSIDPLDEFLVSTSCDGTSKIWELKFGAVVKTFSEVVPVKNDFYKAIVLGHCAWKPQSGSFLAVPKGLELFIYRRHTWEENYRLSPPNIEQDLTAAIISPCGGYIAAGSVGGEIFLWEGRRQLLVGFYKDPKKIGICRMAWHSLGCHILFSDRVGRMGILTGIEDAIIKPPPVDQEARDSVFDCFDDDEDCISLEKIKSTCQSKFSENIGGDDGDVSDECSSRPTSPSSSSVYRAVRTTPKIQPPFQPSSTPSNFEPRCLCYNSIGIVRYYDSDRTIDIQFHDTAFHHSLFLRSFGVCTMATLSSKVLCLAVPSVDDNASKLTCVSLGFGNKEWTTCMPEGEDILAVAASGDWVAVATNANNIRIFTFAGTQKQVLALAGPIVAMSGYEKKLFVTYHAGVFESQNINFGIYEVSGIYVRTMTPLQPLPLSPKSLLKWIGFTDEGTPCTYDSNGHVRILGHDCIHWMVVSNTQNQRKSSSDHYFVVGLSEANQNIRCILCRNSHYPLVIHAPTIVEISLRMPLCDTDDGKSIAEDTFWRLLFSIYTMQKISFDSQDVNSTFELPMKQAILKLFGGAVNNSDDLRAVELASFMTEKALDVAVKYAMTQGRSHLADKLKSIKPVDWNNYYPVHSANQPSNEDADVRRFEVGDLNSQRDMFEESPQKVSRIENPINAEPRSYCNYSPQRRGGQNPFKKTATKTTESPKGLKYFDTLKKDFTSTQKSNKPFGMNQPLKLKLQANKKTTEVVVTPENEEVDKETKERKFTEWFQHRMTSLAEDNPGATPSELVRIGTKIFKKEMGQVGKANNCLEVIESDSSWNSSKRSLLDDPGSIVKRFKNLDESL